jgi:hypothetical protein
MVFGVRINLSLEDEVDHKRIDDRDREHDHAGAPEKERDAFGRRCRLLDRNREWDHIGIERYRERAESRAEDREPAEERISVSAREIESAGAEE